jgi:predicted unusual protein kinase regulating ubiquinone biosynthesis (AarF/ABC1/UbiB family)
MDANLLALIEGVTERLAVQCQKMEKTFKDVDLEALVKATCGEDPKDVQLVNLVANQIKSTYISEHKTVDDTIRSYISGCRMAMESSVEMQEMKLSADRYFQMCERYDIKLDTPVVNVVTQVSKYANALKDMDVRKLFVQVGLMVHKAAKASSDKEQVKQAVYQEIESTYRNK